MALAYLLGKTTGKLAKVEIVTPFLLVLSILPDADLLFPFIAHRGPTHSAITALVVFIPFLVVYRRKALPYLVALLSHSLVGDFFVGGHIQLLWPFSTRLFGFSVFNISITSPVNVALESILFVLATIVMFKSKDIRRFFEYRKSNLVLVIPIFTVLLPAFVAFPLDVPILLAPEHLFYLVLFTVSVILTLVWSFKKKSAT